MILNLEKGISVRVSGEVGQYNSLPVEVLIKMMENLQELIKNIALVSLNDQDSIDVNQFKIELCGFKTGSAVPQFQFTQRYNQALIGSEVAKQNEKVSEIFEEIIENYNEPQKFSTYIKSKVQDPERRNNIVESLHGFTNATGSPINFVDFEPSGNIVSQFKVPLMTKGQRDSLIVKIKPEKPVTGEEIEIQKIKSVTENGKRKGKPKILSRFKADVLTEFSHTFANIEFGGRIYNLYNPLQCKLEIDEDKVFVLENETLVLVGTGMSLSEASESFQEEFDEAYYSYNHYKDSQLAPHLLRAKNFINFIVKKVDE